MMRRSIFSLSLLIALLFASCSMLPHKPVSPGEAKEEIGKSVAKKSVEFFPTASRFDIEERFGKPLSVREEAVPNRHDPDRMDTTFEYNYEGVVFTIYHATYNDQDFIIEVYATKPGFCTEAGVSVGDPVAKVQEAYETVNDAGPDTLVIRRFLSDDSPVSQVYRFDISEGKVKAITILLEGL